MRFKTIQFFPQLVDDIKPCCKNRVWINVIQFPQYYVSSCGDVVSMHGNGNRLLYPYLNKERGYYYISLEGNGKRKNFSLHRLIAETFCVGFFPGLEVNHIDYNRLNNHAANLEWVSRSENHKHAYRNGRPKHRNRAKINWEMAEKIRELKKTTSLTNEEIGKKFGIKQPAVSLILNNKRWVKENKQ